MMHVSGNMPDFGSRARRISFAVAVVSVYLLVGAPARSHEPPPVPATEAASATELGPAVINNLQEALAHVAWDTAAHGPLIAVAPGEVMPTWMRQLEHRQAYPDGIGGAPEGPPPLLRLPSGEYTVPDLADYFDLRPVRLRGITVLAPGSMWVLNTPTAPPDPFASVEFGEKCLMLEGTLSPEQWQEFGSDQGLGLSDLQAEQRSLFLSILPDSGARPCLAPWLRERATLFGTPHYLR